MRRIALLSVIAVFAACSESTSGTGYLRVANLSPDLGALDFCIAPAGGTYSSPVMAGAGALAGLARADDTNEGSLAVSKYFPYTAGNYDVRVYDKESAGSSCTNPLLTATNVSLGDGVYKLLAAVGYTGSATAPHALVTFTDERTVSSTNVAIRFANTAVLFLAGTPPTVLPLPAIDVGVTAGTTYTPIFTNIAYPGIAASGTDANGYVTVPAASFTGAVELTVCPNPLLPSSGLCQSTPVPAGSITGGVVASAYVIGLAGVPPNALLCGDSEPPPVAGYQYSLCTTTLTP